MKKLVFASVLFMSVFFAHAQVSVNINIGTPPNWGPQGYDDSRYYYLPDIDIYYDVAQSQYIYDNNGRWVRERRLPAKYRQYDLYSGYKVVLNDYKGDAPYSYHSRHRASYPKGYHGTPQKTRGEKPAKKNKSHGNQKHDNRDKNNSKKQSNKDHGSHNDRH
ncbi:hypothetical protein [Flavobacterium johnsoniae]|jgi:hypothetical protein|uniref:Uncharacterized protein n=1 Tax=Flavobacterium johnsoniae TaxID=986 RepID=A0A1J7BNE1_FLAJO|nr:hypothetical protein [Flavobacterium johnsoniae]OIV40227.1 hypothetical protein BKM63_20005 [Flavobacterium johnsoniae]